MKPALLDTDILLDILQGGNSTVQENAQRYLTVHGRYTITAITVAELARGTAQGQITAEWLDALLERVEVLALDAIAAKIAGQIYQRLENQGMRIGLADCLIAGIALSHERVLVTANQRHFLRVAAL
ncbi:MAG: PIN domain-containing protein, partial [Anaerolineae bacterium]|nr:PIN domain-containing protein [Anaerolineae bacterium]